MIEVKDAVIPELRFPEFEGEWVETKLGDFIIDHRGGASFKPKDFVSYSGCEVIPKKAISRGGRLLLDEHSPTYCNPTFFSNNPRSVIDESYLITTLRDLVPSGPNIGYLVQFKSNKSYILAQGVYALKLDMNKVVREFLIHYSNSFNYRKVMRTIMVGSTQVHIRNQDYFNIRFHSPKIQEQQKIATFLTAVDKRIQMLQQKKEKLERYKKGVMQKLFSQEIRFKDEKGEDYPDWEEKKLGEVTNIYDGTHQTPKYVESGIPFYSVEHISANQFSSTKYISEKVFEKENQRVRLESGDILMTRIGSIGVAKYIDWDVRASFYVSLALLKQRADFDGKFLSYAIHNSRFQRELWKRTIHVAFPQKINLGEIGKCRISLPSLPEQKRIAAFLSSLYKKIDQVTQQIEHTRQWKKGLLQKMFV
ncbi:MAG: restriction endonuclease subunit S [Balneolales bacterium]